MWIDPRVVEKNKYQLAISLLFPQSTQFKSLLRTSCLHFVQSECQNVFFSKVFKSNYRLEKYFIKSSANFKRWYPVEIDWEAMDHRKSCNIAIFNASWFLGRNIELIFYAVQSENVYPSVCMLQQIFSLTMERMLHAV